MLYSDRIDWFKTDKEVGTKQPSGTFPLSRFAVVVPQDSEFGLPFGFKVEIPATADGKEEAKKYVFAADDEKQRKAWVSSLMNVVSNKLGTIFGGRLFVALRRSPFVVPALVHSCIQWMKIRALKEEGLLRVPGGGSIILSLKEAYENNEWNPSQLMSDPHSVAGVLKLYFRELKDSIIPSALHAKFMAIKATKSVDMEAKVIKLKALIDQEMDQGSQFCLNYVIYFLTLLSGQSAFNQMKSKNCAMVLAPGLMRSEKQGVEINPQAVAEQMLEQEAVVNVLIDHYWEIFPQGPPYE